MSTNLEVGIVGLPNVGKSTLFNAITKAGAEAANYPFCTIEPNVGVVDVPDNRLAVLAEMFGSKRILPAAMRFVDIAGLVEGASKGEGLGNKFLSHIRQVDAIAQVIRCFDDPNITHVAGSIDPEKQATFKYYPAGSILLQVKNHVGSSFDKESEPYGSSKLQLEENPLESQTLRHNLENTAGIESVTAFNSVQMSITFPSGSGSLTSIMNVFPTLNREQLAEKQAVLSSGTADYDVMTEKYGILASEKIANVGDTLQLEGRSPDGSTFNVDAVVVGTYNPTDLMERSPVVPGSPYFMMTYDMAKNLTGITEQTGILAITVTPNHFDEVLSAVQEIAEQNGKISVNTIEQTIKNIEYRYSSSIKALYMAAAILFTFGGISLMNMLMVDFQNRKREFGLLEAVGATQKQLKAMLSREIGIYLGGSLTVSLVLGTIISIIACQRLEAVNHCITLNLPWLFLIALIAAMVVIYMIFTAYAKAELRKTGILSAIREE